LLGSRKVVPRPVLAADTTLDLDGEIIGKPKDEADAAAILARLSGRSHRVLTAIAMARDQRIEHRLSISEVRFRVLSAEEIRRYVQSGEPMDKAGAYGIQGRAAMFVEDIKGSHSGIVGLPLCETALLLRDFGYPL
jgi:septum formation protein